jgi:ATPase subunit of ABC transporter with duplicated ATPase domains
VLVISHDRYFLDQVVDQVIELDGGPLHSYQGGYTDYLAAVGR